MKILNKKFLWRMAKNFLKLAIALSALWATVYFVGKGWDKSRIGELAFACNLCFWIGAIWDRHQ